MSGFMKTVSKTACTKIAGMILGNRSDSVHKYGHVVLRVLSTLCTLKVTSHLRGSLSGSSEKKFVRTLVSIKP